MHIVHFPATSWSNVLAARDRTERTPHLDRLFRTYWEPVFQFIRRTWNKPDDEARDLTQDFFLRLLETDFLKDVSPEKGRFRAYLKACLRHFLLDARKFAMAEKRGGAAKVFSIDAAEKPVDIAAVTPEASFDLEWTYVLVRSSLPALEQALKAMNRDATWKLFKAVDIDAGPDNRPTYAQLASQTGQPEQKVKSEIDYARKMLRRLILTKIRDYTVTDADAAAELKELFPG
jgi:RNA polymerase sigma-70 factor (ECF subfamily)